MSVHIDTSAGWTVRARCIMLIAVTLVLIVQPVVAQSTTFTVTIAEKTEAHPYFQQGFNLGFAIDGVEGAEITLEPGVTYEFVMQNVPSIHPFYITSSELGAGAAAFTEGVTNNFASGNETLVFTPPEDAPSELFYQCNSHERMGYRINISTSTATESDTALPEMFVLHGSYPNPSAASVTVSFDLLHPATVRVELFDLAGRRVNEAEREMEAGAGRTLELETQDLESGTYLYRIRAISAQEVSSRSGTVVLVQ